MSKISRLRRGKIEAKADAPDRADFFDEVIFFHEDMPLFLIFGVMGTIFTGSFALGGGISWWWVGLPAAVFVGLHLLVFAGFEIWRARNVIIKNALSEVKVLLSSYSRFETLVSSRVLNGDVEVEALRSRVAELVEVSLREAQLFDKKFSRASRLSRSHRDRDHLHAELKVFRGSLIERAGVIDEFSREVQSLVRVSEENAELVALDNDGSLGALSDSSRVLVDGLKSSKESFSARVDGLREANNVLRSSRKAAGERVGGLK